MEEDLVPADYLLSPRNFERVFYRKTNYASLRQIALDGQMGELCNRYLAWRVFLGILPEDGALADWVEIVRSKREEYYELKASFLQVAAEDLDPLINNPLSAAQEVGHIQVEPLEPLPSRQPAKDHYSSGCRPYISRESSLQNAVSQEFACRSAICLGKSAPCFRVQTRNERVTCDSGVRSLLRKSA